MIKDGTPYCDICGEEIPITEEYGRFTVPADSVPEFILHIEPIIDRVRVAEGDDGSLSMDVCPGCYMGMDFIGSRVQ